MWDKILKSIKRPAFLWMGGYAIILFIWIILIKDEPEISYPKVLWIMIFLGGWFILSEFVKIQKYFDKTFQLILDTLVYGTLLVLVIYLTGGASSDLHFILFLTAISIPLYNDLIPSMISLTVIGIGCILICFIPGLEIIDIGHIVLEVGSLFVIAAIIKSALDLAKRKSKELEAANVALKIEKDNLDNMVYDRTKDLQIKSSELEEKVKDLNQSKTAIINILEDMDGLTKTLAEEKNKDEAILKSIGDAVLAVDLDRRIIVFNKAAQEITGFKEKEVLEKVYSDVLEFTDTRKNLVSCGKDCMVEEVYKTGKSLYFEEMTIKNKNGKKISIADSVAPVKDISEKVIGAIMTFRDIREELEVEQLKAEAQAAIEIEKTRREFVSVVSHELRTPMTGIKGWLGMLLDGEAGKINPKVKEYLEEAYKNNERLLILIEDMLSVSRIEQGKVIMMPNKIDLGSVVGEVVKDFELQAENKGLKLKYETIKDQPAVYADVNKVKEVLGNLLGNALKFTKEGGVVVENKVIGKKIVTFVEDTGVGIPKQDLRHIFEKFYQAENPLSREQQGTGLGLFITKSLVENMGGEIWVRSRAGKGTTFAFSLPIYTGKESRKEEPTMEFIEKVVKDAKEPKE